MAVIVETIIIAAALISSFFKFNSEGSLNNSVLTVKLVEPWAPPKNKVGRGGHNLNAKGHEAPYDSSV